MKTIAESETIYTELMIPSYANFGGKVHGGIILSIMDKVAYVCASKHSGSYVVTVSGKGVEFLSPVEVGDLLTIKASINYGKYHHDRGYAY
jgi:acyl-CoA hydrolase